MKKLLAIAAAWAVVAVLWSTPAGAVSLTSCDLTVPSDIGDQVDFNNAAIGVEVALHCTGLTDGWDLEATYETTWPAPAGCSGCGESWFHVNCYDEDTALLGPEHTWHWTQTEYGYQTVDGSLCKATWREGQTYYNQPGNWLLWDQAYSTSATGTLAASSFFATPDAEVVGNGISAAAGDTKDTVVDIGTNVFPYGAGLGALALGWRFARRWMSA